MPLWFAQVFPGGTFIVGLGWTRVKARGYIATGDKRHLGALPVLIRLPSELLRARASTCGRVFESYKTRGQIAEIRTFSGPSVYDPQEIKIDESTESLIHEWA